MRGFACASDYYTSRKLRRAVTVPVISTKHSAWRNLCNYIVLKNSHQTDERRPTGFPERKFKEQKLCSLNKLSITQLFFSGLFSLEMRSQDWLPTVQLVLQADWQVLLHSPQPVTFFSAGRAIVLILFMVLSPRLSFLFPLNYNIPRGKLQAFLQNIGKSAHFSLNFTFRSARGNG